MAPHTTIVVSEAVEQLQAHVQAYEAIEQLLSLDSAASSDTHLPGVRRDAFAALLGVVNASLASHCRQLLAATAPLRTEP